MQVWLKRHPLYKDDHNERSIVTPGSGLAKRIKRFEQLSRNYKGVDFSKKIVFKHPDDTLEKLKNLPKVLITGFDPFFLNEFDHPWKSIFNIRQSNPSGCVALALADTFELGANIQTMIFPVRYTDFDGSTAHDNGQGIGVVEEYIQPWIEKVDMVITISQAGEGDYNIDVFATATRGGTFENMDFTRVEGSKSVSNIAPETIVTTLNKKFTEHPSQAIYYGRYFETKSDSQPPYNPQNASVNNYPNTSIHRGPVGNYLSNEIFYRVAEMKRDINPSLESGHFHIAKLQDEDIKEDYKNDEMKRSVKKIEETIKNGIKGL
ncbi:MAG: hypothetical protein AAGI25_20950 [Bacteroidota bacterium]